MGKLDVGRIVFGNIDFSGTLEKKSLEIKKFSIDGVFGVTITGNIRLNLRNIATSRLHLCVSIEIKDEKAVKKNPSLTTVLSFLTQYQDRKNKKEYHFDVKGTLSSPNMQRSRKINLNKKHPSRKKKTSKRR
jgi:hypothetical protein